MNAEQKQRIAQAVSNWRSYDLQEAETVTENELSAMCSSMAALLQELVDAPDAERYRKIAIAVMCCRSIKFNEGGPVYDAAGCVMDSFDPEAVVVAGSGQRYVAGSIEAALLEMYRAEFEPDDAAMSEKGQS